MRIFLFGIFISWLTLWSTPSYQTSANTWSKKSCTGASCCLGGQSQPNALKNLLPKPTGGTEGTEIRFVLEPGDNSVTEEVTTAANGERIFKYVQSTPFRVGIDKDRERDDQINILGKTTPNEMELTYDFLACGNQLTYRLQYQENGHTYMFWELGKANWFFTAYLTGCDMFIAKKGSDKTKVLIIHSNLNRLNAPEQQMDNLKLKGEMAQIITDANPGYRLVMRLHAKPTCPNAKIFIEQYKADHATPGSKISVYDYDADQYQDGNIFFGKDGKFYVKPKIGEETRELKANLE